MSSSSISQNISGNASSETVKVSEHHASTGFNGALGTSTTQYSGVDMATNGSSNYNNHPHSTENKTSLTMTIEHLSDTLPFPPELTKIVGNYSENPFIFSAEVRKFFEIMRIQATGVFSIDWGDGTIKWYNGYARQVQHMYSIPGEYEIRITGDITRINIGFNSKILEISQWGCLRLVGDAKLSFATQAKLYVTASDHLDISGVTNAYQLFAHCPLFNCDVSKWDVSKIENMASMFSGCSSFTGAGLSNWNVANVVDMNCAFLRCPLFNGDVSRWNTSNVVDMSCMFGNCCSFNGDVSGWDVSKVNNMAGMFSNCKVFKSDLSRWSVYNVRNTNRMFMNCEMFNCDLNNWHIPKLTDSFLMFSGCLSFSREKSKFSSFDF